VAEDLIVLDGCTFFYSDGCGDVDAHEAEGLFYEDVRHLSRWQLTIDGETIEPLSSRRVDYYSARIVAASTDDGDAPPLAIRRDRFVTDGVHEDVHVENLTGERRTARIELTFGSDFADVLEAQEGGNGAGRHWADARARSATLWTDREGYRRGTAITFNRRGRVTKDRAIFDVELPPHGSWSLCVDITPIVDGRRRPPLLRCSSFHEHAGKMPVTLDAWLTRSPELITENSALQRTYRQSLLDLAALRVRPDEVRIHHAMPPAGCRGS
jgi:N-terminal domain of (some) glycogen debranching enzymes